ncbi:MAG TPA: efflux RND transporter permease subunit [Firmicutes bacterium]|nr:efflux RND transporter permease subunit [Bacillota bacterium]
MPVAGWAVRRPVAVFMCTLTLLVFGAVTLPRLPLDLFPQISYPVASVAVIYPGATAQTVQDKVTIPVEAALAGLPGVKQVSSYSLENLGVVILEFEWGTDVTQALGEIQAQVSRLALTLPKEIRPPMVLATDPRQFPVLVLAVRGDGRQDLAQLTEMVDNEIAPALRQVPDVVQVTVEGGKRARLEVRYDQERLRELGLNRDLLAQLLVAANTYVPAGTITEGGRVWQVRTGYSLKTVDDLANVVVGVRPPATDPLFPLLAGVPQLVRLKDIATITKVYTTSDDSITRVNGEPAILLHLQKRSGANTVRVVNAVNARLQALRLEQRGVEVYPLIDQSLLVRNSIQSLSNAGLWGALLAVASLFLFLGKRWREVLLISLSIPLSVSITLIVMGWLGQSLNLMTLGGIALALGMVVDNAIVVTENFSRLSDRGMPRKEAAVVGASEVAAAICASTLTTVAVFLPVVFIRGLASALFGSLGLTVTLALMASLAVALTVIPAAASRWGSRGKGEEMITPPGEDGKPPLPASHELNAGARPWYLRFYERFLQLALARRYVVLGLALLALAAALSLWPRLDTQLLPAPDEDVLTVKAALPPGTASERTLALVARLEAALRKDPEVLWVASQIGGTGTADVSSFLNRGSHRAQLTVRLRPAAARTVDTDDVVSRLLPALLATARDFSPDATVTLAKGGGFGSFGMLYDSSVIAEVRGKEYAEVTRLAGQLEARLRRTGRFTAVYSDSEQDVPELRYTVSPARAAMGAVVPGQVGQVVRQALTGEPVLSLSDGSGASLPVVLRPNLPGSTGDGSIARAALSELEIPPLVDSPSGGRSVTTLGRVATEEEQAGPAVLRRVDGLPAVQVVAELGSLSQSRGAALVRQTLQQLPLPPGYHAGIVGTQELIDESIHDLYLVLALSLFLVYVVMAVQFESPLRPWLIMATIPLAATGSLFSLFLTRTPLGLSSLMGMVILGGIIVNNGIVLVDRMNQLRRQGWAVRAAVMEAAPTRLRPVLMTAITTILGLLPLVVGPYAHDAMQTPLAVALIGGMTSGTLLTLVVVPVVYDLAESWRLGREKISFTSRKITVKEESRA